MAQFAAQFLGQFPDHLQAQLEQFSSLVDARQKALSRAPRMDWPPPTALDRAFDHLVELVWQANETKGLSFCSGIIQSLNEANFLCFAVTFRAFYEQILLVRQYMHARLLPVVKTCQKKGQVEFEEMKALISDLHSVLRRSRVDWENFLMGQFQNMQAQDAMDQVGLKNAAKAWRDTGEQLGALDPVALYSVLCDLAHPNFGSALICMQSDSFGFATNSFRSLGIRVFGFLYPSLAAVAMEFQKLQNALLLLKLDQQESNYRNSETQEIQGLSPARRATSRGIDREWTVLVFCVPEDNHLVRNCHPHSCCGRLLVLAGSQVVYAGLHPQECSREES
jgi:hypothetical protein